MILNLRPIEPLGIADDGWIIFPRSIEIQMNKASIVNIEKRMKDIFMKIMWRSKYIHGWTIHHKRNDSGNNIN